MKFKSLHLYLRLKFVHWVFYDKRQRFGYSAHLYFLSSLAERKMFRENDLNKKIIYFIKFISKFISSSLLGYTKYRKVNQNLEKAK